MIPNKDYDNSLNNSESESVEGTLNEENISKAGHTEENSDDDKDYASEDKYLALEQPGVSFTEDADPLANNPDNLEYRQHGQGSDVWDNNNRNSRNAEAFNQDELILRDNIDLDEDQSTSISSDDDFDADTNTQDGL